MAIVKFGATVVGIRGTIGGITYSASKAGPYVRGWSVGANPRATKQMTQRAYLSNQCAAWRALTGAQRTTWINYAAAPAQALTNSLGETYYASGFNWFTTCNTRLTRMGLANVVNAPVVARPAAPTGIVLLFYVTGSTTSGRVNWTSGQMTGYNAVIEMQIFNSTGRSVASSGFKEVRLIVTPGAAGNTIETQYAAVFGATQLGQKAFVRVYRQTAEGDRSAPGTANSIALTD